ncbi:MAG: NAD(P)H-quinone oxidoreductase subunit J, chloroplastic [Phycisphaerae bacterium]|nr:NAD(P)H-quinone oxidoreductase subunit J, chloroplastic [Phycisphaerae bacterium]
MTPEAVLKILKDTFGDDVKSVVADGLHPYAEVAAGRWREIARYLRDDPRLAFNWLRCISAVDHLEDKLITVVYDLHAAEAGAPAGAMWKLKNEIAIRIRVERDRPHIPSVADVWRAADWHEREAFDLLGVIFDGHPDLKRILCCEDWVGHPLRKDYEFPLEYHGIPAVTEYNQTRTVH